MTSSLPNSATVFSTSAMMSASFPTSATTEMAFFAPPSIFPMSSTVLSAAALLMSAATTGRQLVGQRPIRRGKNACNEPWAPSEAKRRALSSPIPLPAPVMMATKPSRRREGAIASVVVLKRRGGGRRGAGERIRNQDQCEFWRSWARWAELAIGSRRSFHAVRAPRRRDESDSDARRRRTTLPGEEESLR